MAKSLLRIVARCPSGYDALRIVLALLLLSAACLKTQLAMGPLLGAGLLDSRVSGPYCGIYSLYVCLSALGIEANPRNLVSTGYIGSFRGSTSDELIGAAKDFGAQAESFSHLTHRELRRVQTPMILHMRSSWSDASFNHWVAFLGCDGDRMRIVDAPHPLETISVADLLANWDGSAIAISKGPVDETFILDSRMDYVLGFGLLLLAVYALGRAFHSDSALRLSSPLPGPVKRLAMEAGGVVGCSLVLAFGYHSLSEIGFLRNPTALAEVTRRHYSVEIPEISLADTEREIREDHPVLLDARHVLDYRHGALPGAKSMSVDSTLAEREQTLAGVPRDKRIIVYCQSAGCGYAQQVARFLVFNGYSNVVIYRDGYRVWRQSRATTETADARRTAAKRQRIKPARPNHAS